MEMWDLLDINGEPIGKTHPRQGTLPQGTYHRVVEIFTINSRDEILITKRSPDKPTYPNYWEVTGGSVVAGEDSLTGALRELREETGILSSPSKMILLMTDPPVHYAFMDIYLTFCDAEISELTMQEGETVAAKWVTFDEFEKMIENGDIPEPVSRRYFLVKDKLIEKLK